jgi:CRISP-associated protein Cas1
MIKRVLYFGNPTYLHTSNNQLQINLLETKEQKTAVIEDLGVVVLDHPQITITQVAIAKLLSNNTALITCDEKHLPTGLLLPLDGNVVQSERFRAQIDSSDALKKSLWQQTVVAKIKNQAALLEATGFNPRQLQKWSSEVKSGDSDNTEAYAAAHYWQRIFSQHIENFFRERNGDAPNHLLNYGYAILRAIVARGLVCSGLLPTLGIFHRNKYNAYCLADDIMEPYRPFVDRLVLKVLESGVPYETMTVQLKRALLSIGTQDIWLEGRRSPLMVGLQTTTASLAKCYLGEARKIIYPSLLD